MMIKEWSLEIRPIDRDLFLGKDLAPWIFFMLDYLPTFSFSSEEASLCCRETGEREKWERTGYDGKGK